MGADGCRPETVLIGRAAGLSMAGPHLLIRGDCALPAGDWRLAHLAETWPELSDALLASQAHVRRWDLSALEALDSAGALLLWRTWGRRLPDEITLSAGHHALFNACRALSAKQGEACVPDKARLPGAKGLSFLGNLLLSLAGHLGDGLRMLGGILLDIGHCLRHPGDIPWLEISANVYKSGVRAMPVSAMVGFLIGVVLCYLSSVQLRAFGAETLIVNILGLGVLRELGPVLVAILIAGRSGSAMTAQLGVMRVTEEIDALAVMGVSRHLRLVLPKVVALSLVMPLLVLWTSTLALFGGMVTAELVLDISYGYFVDTLSRVVPVANLYIGLIKGWAFGLMVALVACHFGLRVRPNTESLSLHTTSSVVTAITMVIALDALFAIATRGMGLPL